MVKRDGTGWKVDEIVREHNHEVTSPSKAHLLPSQRRVKEVQGAQINTLDDVGSLQKKDTISWLDNQGEEAT